MKPSKFNPSKYIIPCNYMEVAYIYNSHTYNVSRVSCFPYSVPTTFGLKEAVLPWVISKFYSVQNCSIFVIAHFKHFIAF